MAFDRYDTIALGQDGSAYLDTAATTFTPAAPKKIVAITMVTDCAWWLMTIQNFSAQEVQDLEVTHM